MNLTTSGRSLSLAAEAGNLTLWPADDADGHAELTLALAGRFRPTSGRVLLSGRDATPAELRQSVIVANVVDAVEPEPRLRLGEYLRGAAVLHGARPDADAVADLREAVGLTPIDRTPVEHLSSADRVRALIAGALLARPVAVVADQIDRGVGESDWPGLLDHLRRAAGTTGVAILASATRTAEVRP